MAVRSEPRDLALCGMGVGRSSRSTGGDLPFEELRCEGSTEDIIDPYSYIMLYPNLSN
jgi:hypothetical protein